MLLALGAGITGTPATCIGELPPTLRQGQLIVARADPTCRITVDGRVVRVAADGTWVFGVGRDAERVVIAADDGTSVERPVAKREWPIERVDGVPPATVTPPPEIAERIAREQARVAQARRRDDARTDFDVRFVRPVEGRVSGVYGSQRVLNGTPKDPHYGLDVAAPTGTAVRAPAGGIVTLAERDFYLTGGTVLVDHGHGLTSAFLHLSRLDVAAGDRVEQGQTIGAVGATGRASGAHLHWGFNWFDVRLDPALLLEK